MTGKRALYRRKSCTKTPCSVLYLVGIYKDGRRKELQQEINEIDIQISNMKKRLLSIVKEYKFDSVRAFYKEFNAVKREYFDYKTARAE